jgi:hypothetical protein
MSTVLVPGMAGFSDSITTIDANNSRYGGCPVAGCEFVTKGIFIDH